jgi:quinol---cytochrome c reductase iron-sulfur subunit, bacillus type
MSDQHISPPPPPPERRRFLKWMTHGLGALFGAVIAVPAVAYIIDPRNRAAAASDFKPVARLDELEIGKPKEVVIRDVRHDAWTVHPNDIIGRVWLIRRDKDKVEAFTTICPHLGCSINYNTTHQMFVCPCHNGTFSLECKKMDKAIGGTMNPPPRDMDSLEVNPAALKEGIVEVKYQNFAQGKHEQIPKK